LSSASRPRPTAAKTSDAGTEYVLRTREAVIIDDASAQNPRVATSITAGPVRGQSCVPLVERASLAGVLYLENTVAAHVFGGPVTVLKLLAAQAAISLETPVSTAISPGGEDPAPGRAVSSG
jgi:GAF domain-containing protein